MTSTTSTRPRRPSAATLGLVAFLVLAVLHLVLASPSSAAPAKINGSGSSYVGLAMTQWVADAQTNGLPVNYLPTSSPAGLTSYGNDLIDFAATEAEFSALTNAPDPPRGYQYVPDVAGAISIMYNVSDKAGRKIDYLHLSRRTIARIFTGEISNWSDPAISADNPLKGGQLELPDKDITVVYRGAQSGTTGLFYDFVQNVAPDVFAPWAAKNNFPTSVRIIQLDSSPNFAPHTMALGGSDQIAQFVASGAGQWSISYDEFGYAKTYGAPSAWVENASGQWVQPYAENIAEALRDATLRPDLSQELSGVYNSANPKAYPISAYSYIVTQCAASPDRPTCKGKYSNEGITETLTKWLRYVACEGQVNMAQIGYSPLPAELSQEVANSIGRLNGTAPETLTADNCANPRFRGELGPGAAPPPDPLLPSIEETDGGTDNGSGGTGGATESALGDTAAATTAGGKKSAGGGSGNWQDAAPVAYANAQPQETALLPMVLLLAAVLVLPAVLLAFIRRRRS